MKKGLLFLLLFPIISVAQLTDDFSDGDFTNNPAWSGDASEFIVNASQQLQLNSAGAATSYLSVGNNSPSLANTTWQFYIHLNFSPSSSNYSRVYLVSDQSNLEGSLNGYYLQFGETGSNDAIELFKQTGTSSTSIARGTDGFIANTFTISIQVTRDNTGNWSILADPAAGTNFVLQATGNDITYNTSSFFGVVCTYTSSNATNFFFDNFVFPFTVDLIPPAVSSVTATSSNQVDVSFNEPVEQLSAETTSNYSVNNGIGTPASATLTASNTIHLTFAANFSNGVTNTLNVLNVKDLNNNPITTASTGQFTWFAPVTPEKYDIVITEFMADPDPQVGLPNAEYVEIYNRSSKTFDLGGWKISDSGSPNDLNSFILTPGSYLILCSTSNVSALSSFGNALGVSNFPTFNNPSDGGNDDIVMYDNNSAIIDKIHYDELWFHDPSKTDGGWSIERIDPDFTCTNASNWKAAVAAAGGTPGHANSVDGSFAETEPPLLVRAAVSGSNSVNVYFSEAMNSTMISSAASYTADNGLGNPFNVSASVDFTSATLTFSNPVQNGIIYTLTVSPVISDCAGNSLTLTNKTRFAIPDSVISPSDILLNEILYNAKDDGVAFVEIYNRSNKIFDLSQTKIASLKENTDTINYSYPIATEGYLFFPGDYLALTASPDIVKSQYQTTNPSGFVTVPSLETVIYTNDATVLITDNHDNRIDRFYYSDDFQFPLLNDPEGVSLERISFNRPTQDTTNWHSAAEAVGFATPAYENSQHAEVIDDGSEVSVSPEIFSPDNDGNDDVVNINYHFGEPGYIANLKIFDSKGREMIHLVKNELLGINGTFTWDGITKENEKARVGIYVAYLEIFNEKGVVKKFKKPIVLASKL